MKKNNNKLGISIDKNGFIIVNKEFRTNYKNIFAIGDVIGGPLLAHKAEMEGFLVSEIIKKKK